MTLADYLAEINAALAEEGVDEAQIQITLDAEGMVTTTEFAAASVSFVMPVGEPEAVTQH
jgi:hypothetical protein